MKSSENTEQKILEAAAEVFQEKGYDGARMREIADRAQINKGLLHYYFRSKDKLFESIFTLAFSTMVNRIRKTLDQETTLIDKIDAIVDSYLKTVSKNPYLPRFVINELSKNPDKFIARFIHDEEKGVFNSLISLLQEEISQGRIRPVEPRQFLISLFSMIIFPFVGRPLLQVIIGLDKKDFEDILKERKKHIMDAVKSQLFE